MPLECENILHKCWNLSAEEIIILKQNIVEFSRGKETGKSASNIWIIASQNLPPVYFLNLAGEVH